MGTEHDKTIKLIERAMLTLVARHSPYADQCFNHLQSALFSARAEAEFAMQAPQWLIEGLDEPSVGEDNVPEDVFEYPHIAALMKDIGLRKNRGHS